MTIPPFETTFAVPLSCESCVNEVSKSLYELNGINNVSADLQRQVVSVEGTAAPSAIVAAIEATGRDAILRGSGKSDSAAVCILETHSTSVANKVRGLARMVQVASNLTIIDLSIRGVSPGSYYVSVRERGDISRGAASAGSMWGSADAKAEGQPSRGAWGTIDISRGGRGAVFLDKPVQIWEVVGRSIVVAKTQDGPFRQHDPDTLVGVIARSAGVWDNDKTVCSCSGKTVWEERKEQVDRGML